MSIELIGTLTGMIFGAVGTYIAIANEFYKREKGLTDRIKEQTSREVNMNRDYQFLKLNCDQLTALVKDFTIEVDRKFDSVFDELKEIRKEFCEK